MKCTYMCFFRGSHPVIYLIQFRSLKLRLPNKLHVNSCLGSVNMWQHEKN
uniref:Uncharacterized protein n=1 Tax=Arundo donax TaxID=35708 RepID=A0A0A9C3S7_ARUDO